VFDSSLSDEDDNVLVLTLLISLVDLVGVDQVDVDLVDVEVFSVSLDEEVDSELYGGDDL
jgi:hypothetical protein